MPKRNVNNRYGLYEKMFTQVLNSLNTLSIFKLMNIVFWTINYVWLSLCDIGNVIRWDISNIGILVTIRICNFFMHTNHGYVIISGFASGTTLVIVFCLIWSERKMY